MLDGLGIKHGIDMPKLLAAGAVITKALGRPTGSKAAMAMLAKLERDGKTAVAA